MRDLLVVEDELLAVLVWPCLILVRRVKFLDQLLLVGDSLKPPYEVADCFFSAIRN